MRSAAQLDLLAGVVAVACAITVFVASVLDVQRGVGASIERPAATLPR